MSEKDQIGSQAAEGGISGELRSSPEVCAVREVNELLHDLRSPLSTISTWIEMLRDEHLDDAQRRDGLRIISLSVQEMTETLNGWVTTSGAETRRARGIRPN